MLPFLAVVAFITVVLYVCADFAISSFFVSPHTVQVYSFSPFSVQVGDLISFPWFHACLPVPAIT